jgi:hypothetical protein
MPTVKDISSVIPDIAKELKAISGVKDVYLYGSYATNLTNPNYVVKDVDIIAATEFDSGDLLAIDNSRYSALKIHPAELEDEGFNPKAVAFTKRFLSYSKYNVDHWATSSDGVLLHWGAIPDNQEEWEILHAEAEKAAEKHTGLRRVALRTAGDEKKQEWRNLYDQHIKKYLASNATGWYPSENPLETVLTKAIRL